MPSLTINAGERGRKRGYLECWRLSSQIAVTHDGAQHSWRWLNICRLISRELIPYFTLLTGAAVLYLVNCLYLDL